MSDQEGMRRGYLCFDPSGRPRKRMRGRGSFWEFSGGARDSNIMGLRLIHNMMSIVLVIIQLEINVAYLML